jgi:hypothetical protein
VIREATPDDMPALLERGRAFFDYSPWKRLDYDETAVESTFAHLMSSPEGVIFLSDDGLCGGLVNGLYFSPSTRIAVELFWYAPSEGTELREAFEGWAKDQGAEAVQFSALGDGRRAATERLYRMAGYQVSETAFLKNL